MATMIRPEISIELARLGHMSAELKPPMVLENTCVGTRYIFEATKARFEGDRMRASQKGSASGDWLLVGADGTGTLDVRLTLETDDGALIFVQYNGRADLAPGPGKAPVYIAPRFETGDPRYAWLSKIQAIGKGVLTEDMSHIDYEIYELR